MTPAEAQELLTWISAVERTQPDESTLVARAWAEMLADFPLGPCKDAVMRHYRARPGQRIQPGHIIDLVRQHLRTPPAGLQADQDAQPDRRSIGPGREQRGTTQPRPASAGYLAITQRLAEIQRAAGRPLPAFIERRLADTGMTTQRDALGVDCPYCRAKAGSPCVTVSGRGGLPRAQPHPSRLDLLPAQQPTAPPTEGTSAA